MINKRIIAITGPSGAGKTTLGTHLSNNYNIVIPSHCTTRNRRSDDIEGFYKYLDHIQFKDYSDRGKFFVASGDNEIISKKYGNYYGILTEDVDLSLGLSDNIIIYVSYKDVDNLVKKKKSNYNIQIVNLTFNDIENGVRYRLTHDLSRKQTIYDIERRVKSAIEYDKEYGEYVMNNSNTIYTDVNDIDQTYKEACKILRIK